MRKKIATGLALILLMSGIGYVPNVYAGEQKAEVVDGLVVDEDTAVPLYNSDEDVAAYYLEGEDKGYVILDNDGNVIEFSYQSEIDDFEESDTDCYYGGPGNYYVEEDDDSDVLVNISSDEKVEKDDIEDFEANENVVGMKELMVSNTGIDSPKMSATITLPDGIKGTNDSREYTTIVYNELKLKSKSTLPYHSRYFSYNHNNSGTCGSTAAAIFTYYYYDHVAKSYIKSNKYKKSDDASQKALVNKYKKLIGDDGSGSTTSQVKNGINKYLKSVGKKENCKYIGRFNLFNDVVTKIKDRINHKRPCIVGLTGEPKYGEHWVVGIGYACYYGVNGHSRGYVNFVKVNDGCIRLAKMWFM